MGEEIPLYNLGLSKEELDSLMTEIRSTSYIDEIESGERPREESGLWDTVLPAPDTPKDTSTASLIKHAGKKLALVIASKERLPALLVLQLEGGAKVDELLVMPKDVIEICCNLAIANMGLSEVSKASHRCPAVQP